MAPIGSEQGVQQGDPLGPLLLSLVLHKLVRSIASDHAPTFQPLLDKPHQAEKGQKNSDTLTLEMVQRHFPVDLLRASPTAIGRMSKGDPSSFLIKAVSEETWLPQLELYHLLRCLQ